MLISEDQIAEAAMALKDFEKDSNNHQWTRGELVVFMGSQFVSLRKNIPLKPYTHLLEVPLEENLVPTVALHNLQLLTQGNWLEVLKNTIDTNCAWYIDKYRWMYTSYKDAQVCYLGHPGGYETITIQAYSLDPIMEYVEKTGRYPFGDRVNFYALKRRSL